MAAPPGLIQTFDTDEKRSGHGVPPLQTNRSCGDRVICGSRLARPRESGSYQHFARTFLVEALQAHPYQYIKE